MKYQYSIKQQQQQAFEIAKRSSMLWEAVNHYIAGVLCNKGKRSRKQLSKCLLKSAGPENKKEPIAIGNIRTAAKQVLSGERISIV